MQARKKKTARATAKKKASKAARKKAAPKASKRKTAKKTVVKKKTAKKKTVKKKVAKKKAAKKKVVKKKSSPKAAKKKAAPKKAAKKKTAPKRAALPKKKAVKKKAAPKAAREKAVPKKKEAPKTRHESLRRALVQRREQIVKEAQVEIAKYIKGENRQLVETALDDGDWSVIDLSEDISLRKLGTHRETLLKIDEALRKLSEGTYGKCEDCGDEISAERLRVLPFAIYCRDCQEAREELEAAREERSI